MLLGQLEQPLARRPVAGRAENLAKHAGRRQPGQSGQIDRALGMAGAAQHAPLFRHQRKQMPGADEVGRLARRIDDRLDRLRPLLGRDAGLRVAMIDRHGEAEFPSGAVFDSTMGCSFSRSQTSGRIGMQSCPRPCVIMKLTISGVTFSAAQMKSPSFSRSSASTTMTTSPRAIASTRRVDFRKRIRHGPSTPGLSEVQPPHGKPAKSAAQRLPPDLLADPPAGRFSRWSSTGLQVIL